MKKEVKGYSLWLMPEGEMGKNIESLILTLSSRLKTPPFPPHVTLLGQIIDDKEKIIEKTAQLASSVKGFSVKLSGTGYMDEYFRCLFLIARKDPGLMSANLKARSLFGRMDDSLFMPHLSLVYGDLSVREKTDIVEELITCSDYSFQVSKVSLFSTCGSPHEWRHVKDFPLC